MEVLSISALLYMLNLDKAKQEMLKQKRIDDEVNAKRAEYTKALNDLKTQKIEQENS